MYKIKVYEVTVTFNGTTFIPKFITISQLAQKLSILKKKNGHNKSSENASGKSITWILTQQIV